MESPLDDLADGCLSIPQAVALTQISRSRMYELMDSGQVPSLKVGSRRLIPRKGLLRFLATQIVDAEEGRGVV